MDHFPVIMGEVLFDCFGSDCVPGGAPFNVAWHLQGFGLNPRFISRVGADDLGSEVLSRMRDWGLQTHWIEEDPVHPTGRVSVQLIDNQPEYEILPSQAYDYIQLPRSLGHCADSAFYHGSLAARNGISRNTLLGIRRVFAGRVFVDVNLRDPWWSISTLESLINGATWLKLNENEAAILAGQDDISSLALQRQIAWVILTRGAHGASLYDGSDCLENVTPPRVAGLMDTVGAGDAFSAVTLLGLIEGWEWSVLLQRAAEFAARSCSWRGALSDDRTIYQEILRDWRRKAGG